MSDFSFVIGALDETAKTVPVTFTVAGQAYSRMVNAAYRNGEYDATDTLLRVLDVGRGTINKVVIGVLKSDEQLASADASQHAQATDEGATAAPEGPEDAGQGTSGPDEAQTAPTAP